MNDFSLTCIFRMFIIVFSVDCHLLGRVDIWAEHRCACLFVRIDTDCYSGYLVPLADLIDSNITFECCYCYVLLLH